ncbi:MAG: hypothetical protein RLZZ13_455 [Pseudomonadota bacterium]
MKNHLCLLREGLMSEKKYIVKVKNTKTNETRVRNIRLEREAYLKLLNDLNKVKGGFMLTEIIESE